MELGFKDLQISSAGGAGWYLTRGNYLSTSTKVRVVEKAEQSDLTGGQEKEFLNVVWHPGIGGSDTYYFLLLSKYSCTFPASKQ